MYQWPDMNLSPDTHIKIVLFILLTANKFFIVNIKRLSRNLLIKNIKNLFKIIIMIFLCKCLNIGTCLAIGTFTLIIFNFLQHIKSA